MTSAAVLVESRVRQDDIDQARMAHEPPPRWFSQDPSQLCRLVQMASKDRRLAGNSKLVAAVQFCFYRHLIASGVRRITPRWVNLSGVQRWRIALRCRSQQPMRRCP